MKDAPYSTAVYAAETRVRNQLRAEGHPAGRQLDKLDTELLAEQAAKAIGLPRIAVVEMGRWEAGTGLANAQVEDGIRTIRVTPLGRTPLVVLHEVAHFVADGGPARPHGMTWALRYLWLVNDLLDRPVAERLAVALAETGLRVPRLFLDRSKFASIVAGLD